MVGYLDENKQIAIDAAVEVLEERGPALGRPLVGDLRILFAFDPRRTAILLIGGDKSGRWNESYAEMVPVADQLYDQHLAELAQEDESQ